MSDKTSKRIYTGQVSRDKYEHSLDKFIDCFRDLLEAEKDNADLQQQLTEANRRGEELVALCKEASDYLDTNNLTSIGSTSILHGKFKAAATATSKRGGE